MSIQQEFENFLDGFVPQYKSKYTQLMKAMWLLETTGKKDAGDLQAALETELRLLFSDRDTYNQLTAWGKSSEVTDPLLARQLTVLILHFKDNMLPREMLAEMAEKEAALAQIYNNFRPKFEGKPASENDLKDILKKETDVDRRKAAWEKTKEIGSQLAPGIRELIQLRNAGARTLGFSDYYQMQLELQEINRDWLVNTFDQINDNSEEAYADTMQEINRELSERLSVPEEKLGPWAWSEPFCQEDPLGGGKLDQLVDEIDPVEASKKFYDSIRLDVEPVLERSDLYEREGKNQHAFSEDFDREGDVRILCNVRPTIRWLETMLHELGHAVYDLGIDPNLPWILRGYPHVFTTEAMALIAGRQAYHPAYLKAIIDRSKLNASESLLAEARASERRRQLIFSRWVMVMINFESQMYKNPNQELNKLWWSQVKKYQKVHPPANRAEKDDWAAKYHVGLAPVYYHSYLLGEMFASALKNKISKIAGDTALYGHPEVGQFLTEKLFFPGNSQRWDKLAQGVIGEELTPTAWVNEFSS